MLDTLKHIIQLSETQNQSAAAFNVFGYEDALAVIRAAESLNRPVILMTNRPALEHMPVELLGHLLVQMAENASVPAAVHLDHAASLDAIQKALAVGYTSVMFDGSSLPVDENIRLTRRVVRLAEQYGASVEAEIGSVGYSDNPQLGQSCYTTPEEARSFYRSTGVDALAVSIGTVHRMEIQTASLDFELLKRIHAAVEAPLVIHGSSGVTDQDLTRLVRYGVRKINLGTILRKTFGRELRRQIQDDPEIFDRLQLFKECITAVESKVREKMLLI